MNSSYVPMKYLKNIHGEICILLKAKSFFSPPRTLNTTSKVALASINHIATQADSGNEQVVYLWFQVRIYITVCGTYSITQSVEQPPPSKVKVHLYMRGSAHKRPMCVSRHRERPPIDTSQPHGANNIVPTAKQFTPPRGIKSF
jgi:hypothetical protein